MTDRTMPMNRRTALSSLLALPVSATVLAEEESTPQAPSVRRIATEEHFLTVDYMAAVGRYMKAHPGAEPNLPWLRNGFPPLEQFPPGRRLVDFDLRTEEMDRDGIDLQVISLMQPGVQVFDPDEGTAVSRAINDEIADIVQAHPDRLTALATIPPQAPRAAAEELERAVTRLGMRGAVINSHTKGEYLDDEKFWPIFEAAESLDVPIYLHPREPSPGMFEACNYGGLHMIWGFAAETSLHSLRLILSGVFDVFPKLRLILGHLGEGIPFSLDRIDNRFAYMPQKYKDTLPRSLERRPSEYFRDNFVVSSSGQNWAPAVHFCQQVLGADKVLFGVDYPFEDQPATVARANEIPMDDGSRRAFLYGNAERVFGLQAATTVRADFKPADQPPCELCECSLMF